MKHLEHAVDGDRSLRSKLRVSMGGRVDGEVVLAGESENITAQQARQVVSNRRPIGTGDDDRGCRRDVRTGVLERQSNRSTGAAVGAGGTRRCDADRKSVV